MSSNAKQQWQAILKHLQHLQNVVAAGGSSHTNTRLAVQLGLIITLNGCMEKGPRFSTATWQAMIHKEQVRGYNPPPPHWPVVNGAVFKGTSRLYSTVQ